MSEALYQQAIMTRARAARTRGRLDAPDRSATRDNPLCGDRATVDVALAGGRIAAIGVKVRGCALCEAAADLAATAAAGMEPATAKTLVAGIGAMLAGGPAPLPEAEIFAPVRAHASRHDCVKLPFATLAEALT